MKDIREESMRSEEELAALYENSCKKTKPELIMGDCMKAGTGLKKCAICRKDKVAGKEE